MIGKQQLQITGDQLAAGLATSDYLSDGGIGSQATNINPILTPGVIRGSSVIDASTNVTGKMIASAPDSQATSAYGKTFVDDEGGYYTWDSPVMTKRKTGASTTKYIFGVTDMAAFTLNTYVTLTDNIALWNTSANTLDESWWVTTKSQSALRNDVPHPLLNFESLLWLANGNVLNTIDSSGTIALGVLTLNSNELIYSLGIDPGTGLMMIGVQTTVNYSDTLSSQFFIYLYGAFEAKPRRKVVVEDVPLGFHTVQGTVFIGYGQRIGYWNGSGISFLRKLTNVSLLGAQLPYKHHLSSLGNIFFVVDGTFVLGYGDIINGKKAWFPYYTNTQNSNKVGAISNLGGGQIGIALDTDKFYYSDILGTTSAAGSLYTNNVNFARPVFIRQVRVFTTGITQTSAFGIGGVAVFNESGIAFQNTSPLGSFTNTVAGSTRYVFDFDYEGLKVQTMNLRANIDTQAFGVIRIVVYYDVAE